MTNRAAGFSLDYWEPDDPDVVRYGMQPGWKFSIVEEAVICGIPEMVWRSRTPPSEKTEFLMAEFAKAAKVEPGQLQGFTLFFHPGKGWQMSTRRPNENGWSIQQGLTDDQVRPIFDLLEPYGHPQLGPPRLAVMPPVLARLRDALDGLPAAILARLGS